MIPLGNGAPIIVCGDKYDPNPVNGPATIAPNQLIRRVQFTVANYSVFVQFGSAELSSAQPIFDSTEIPFIPGTYTFDNVQGIRFRNAVAGLVASVSCTGYLEGDPLPLAISQASSIRLGPNGQGLGGVLLTQYNLAGVFNHTPSPGCTGLLIELWSGGGGSGGVIATGAGSGAASGGGGSGMYVAYAIPFPMSVAGNILNIIQLTIGAAGAAGAAGQNNGGNGGTTLLDLIFSGSLGDRNVASLFGGQGGSGSGQGATPETSAPGGNGAILNALQNIGGSSSYWIEGRGGGTGVIYAAQNNYRTFGGTAPRGGAGGMETWFSGVGNPGKWPGGGGGGSASSNGGAALAGAAGAAGGAIVTEYFND